MQNWSHFLINISSRLVQNMTQICHHNMKDIKLIQLQDNNIKVSQKFCNIYISNTK